MEVRILTGSDALARLGSPLDELHAATDAPVTARRPWLETWVRCYPEYEPWALAVSSDPDRLEAAALLGRRKRRGIEELVALGHGPSDQSRLPARSPEAADALAAAVIERLSASRATWRLTFRHLPCGDAVGVRVAEGLGSAEVVEGDGSPILRFGPDRSMLANASSNHRKQVKRMRNRMRKEGLSPEIEHLQDEAAIRAVLPEVEDVCRRRDLQLRGWSSLERRSFSRFFHCVTLEHAARGEAELTVVRLAGHLAAYSLNFLDRGVRRVWSCRLSPEWARYGVGRVANDAALGRALADPECTELDWMRGEEAYKFSMSNLLRRTQDLLAWSSPTVKTVLDARRRLRGRAKQFVSRHDWLQSAVRATRSLQSTGRRQWRGLLSTIARSQR